MTRNKMKQTNQAVTHFFWQQCCLQGHIVYFFSRGWTVNSAYCVWHKTAAPHYLLIYLKGILLPWLQDSQHCHNCLEYITIWLIHTADMFNLCQTLADNTWQMSLHRAGERNRNRLDVDEAGLRWCVFYCSLPGQKNKKNLILIKLLNDKTLFDGLARSSFKVTKKNQHSWSEHDRQKLVSSITSLSGLVLYFRFLFFLCCFLFP